MNNWSAENIVTINSTVKKIAHGKNAGIQDDMHSAQKTNILENEIEQTLRKLTDDFEKKRDANEIDTLLRKLELTTTLKQS